MALTLVINTGSVTKKYALFDGCTPVLRFSFERTMNGFEVCSHAGKTVAECTAISAEQYNQSFSQVAAEVQSYIEINQMQLDTIAVRILAPGTQFQTHQLIDDTFIYALREKEFSMPLHVPFVLQEIQQCKNSFPDATLMAVSDSAFHRSLPQCAREFSIDRSDAETYDIYRFGYHGLSVASVLRRIHPVTGSNPSRVVVCHIGSAVSVTGVKDGQSQETSMGYSSTSGLPMGTQAGDIDPGGLLQLMRLKNLKPSEAGMYVHAKGGLQGLAETADIRQLLAGKARGDAVASQALATFIYQIKKAIAASMVSLGGIDMLVLTGTACTRSAELRTAVTSGLEYLGLVLDEERNQVLVGQDGVCSRQKSAAKIAAIRSDEMGEMARVIELLKPKSN